ncbi:MAG: hypothetical protein CO030_00385 [Candidatus Magasanikbacteria bacterium CG_4_9_14_0_2_um_filter_42_11]|uniref:Uncharacterized protein n=1 Tax=Candidatus Magasanikbacteria bacterium CG_4_9_14_0_2_um_filter_42_11 TaxID=1974643 RepID=A0A2M8FB18_9BACT|nr:MAG: hypothetical protein COU34_00300 [Candidatus Magasanikbacteria bacterium CG10_big_fil_rev_8_21_14_0_10_43_9]PIY92592.1 MAG: hypothetical protein COY70_02410 [Candidatus Magasanikbacteria bacterium CG_4_10_14_0_8_um_filter_42_12]PJC52917.1 MAG: hypothetical protein CO030_00385 [Candidatus Magasanikbacteria bacterium CG_4_9_14_0_2_um_filter_42_11]
MNENFSPELSPGVQASETAADARSEEIMKIGEFIFTEFSKGEGIRNASEIKIFAASIVSELSKSQRFILAGMSKSEIVSMYRQAIQKKIEEWHKGRKVSKAEFFYTKFAEEIHAALLAYQPEQEV